MKKRRLAFSLMEIMVVVVIIALLAGMVIKNSIGQGELAKVEITKTTLCQVADALNLFKLTTGKYPGTEEGLSVLTEGDTPQLTKMPKDAWDAPVQYQCPGSRGKFDLWSYGANGVEGGEGVDRDIYYGEEEK